MDDVRTPPKKPADDATSMRNGRLVVVLVVGLLAVVVAYFALGMPGMGHGGSSDAGHETVDGEHNP